MAIEKILFNSQEFIKMLSPIKLKKGTWVKYMATYDYADQAYVLDEDAVFSCVGITPHGFFLYRDKVLCHRANVGGAKPESLRLIYAYMDKGQIQI